jgi:hypothetical protein
VQAHAASAVLNFSENCMPDILTPYLDGVVSKLLVLLQVYMTIPLINLTPELLQLYVLSSNDKGQIGYMECCLLKSNIKLFWCLIQQLKLLG